MTVCFSKATGICEIITEDSIQRLTSQHAPQQGMIKEITAKRSYRGPANDLDLSKPILSGKSKENPRKNGVNNYGDFWAKYCIKLIK